MTIESNYELLSKLELFESLGPAQLKRLIFFSKHYQLQPGEYLFHKGDDTDSVFGVVKGEFSVILPSDDGDIVVDQPKCGSLVGEMAVISGELRTASMRAESHSEVIEIDSELFLETITGNPAIAKKMMQLLARRLVNINKMLEDKNAA
ncbi:MAG: Crp/Fnr family transcriptional regulator [Granulosicoccus sp.]